MRPLIPLPWYYDPAVFAREQRTLFARVWQFAGFTADLANADDYVTAEVGGRSVVVQNFDGALRAFRNVCSHRFARIRSEACGNGKLRCPYHGWIYNAEGIPYSIPARPRFDDLRDRAEVAKLALTPYELAVCGGLVFLRESGTAGPSLREFLAGSWDIVEAMSLALGERVYRNEILFRSNWKVAVENGLEAYHVGFVHETTFNMLGTSGMNFRFTGAHSSWHTGLEPGLETRMRKLARLGKMPAPVDGYLHQLVFPNLTISSVGGTAFGFQLLTPLSPTETRLTGIVYVSRMEGAPQNVRAMITEQLGPSSATFTLDVAHEDRAICEAVQLGLPEADRPGVLSEEEERVAKFHEVYMACMTGDGASLATASQ